MSQRSTTGSAVRSGLTILCLCTGLLVLGGCSQSLSVKAELLNLNKENLSPEAREALLQLEAKYAVRASQSRDGLLARVALTEVWTAQAADLIRGVCRAHFKEQDAEIEMTDEKWRTLFFPQSYGAFSRDVATLDAVREMAAELRTPDSFARDDFIVRATLLLDAATQAAEQVAYVTRPGVLEDQTRAFAPEAEGRSLELMKRMAMDSEQSQIPMTARQARQQVGGFFTPTIFEINPGHEIYHYVLDAPPKRTPFSRVISQAGGESTIMIVQESPGQFRLKEISNNPAQLLQNAAFVSDMVLRAAAKYATGL